MTIDGEDGREVVAKLPCTAYWIAVASTVCLPQCQSHLPGIETIPHTRERRTRTFSILYFLHDRATGLGQIKLTRSVDVARDTRNHRLRARVSTPPSRIIAFSQLRLRGFLEALVPLSKP